MSIRPPLDSAGQTPDLTITQNSVHTHLGITYLLSGNFKRGWEEYEWRLKTISVLPLKKSKWTGGTLKDRIILVHSEQGFGDTFQFVRYLPLLHEKFSAKKVLFLPPEGLEQLLRESELGAKILDASISEEAIDYDTNIHLLSLPRIFKTDLENIPYGRKRYFKANEKKVASYKKGYFRTNKLKVGIFWQGSPGLKLDRHRSVPLHHFYPLCRLPDVKIYSLQKGHGIEQLEDLPEGGEITNLGETFKDFADTAAAIENLDIVITVDTAIGHLSGGLGKKTWILLPSYMEWRWHPGIDYSPWYKDVKLFRHKELGRKDWDEMMHRVKKELYQIK